MVLIGSALLTQLIVVTNRHTDTPTTLAMWPNNTEMAQTCEQWLLLAQSRHEKR